MPEQASGFLLWTGSLLTGAVLGLAFFGGLWWTVRHAARSPTPARWFIGSLVVRTALVLVGFYAVGVGQPAQIVLCLLGFLLARAIVLRVTKHSPGARAPASGVPPCA